jgi:hypothetical protein
MEGRVTARNQRRPKVMTDKDKALVCYRTLVDDLQGRTIYMEDDEGVLRRWTPPRRPIFDKKEASTDATGI